MFFRYISDMKSWIFFYILSIALVDFILWLDEGIIVEFSSVLYFNMLLLLFFLGFLIWRYYVEMNFTKNIAQLIEGNIDDWGVALPESLYYRDELTKGILLQAATNFSIELEDVKRFNIQEGDYTAAWVHEVKTPLTAMKLIIDEHHQDPVFRRIEAEWLRLHLLVEQQLSISRLPSLEADYVLEKTSVQKLVSMEVRELMSWCLEKNIGVEFEGEEVNVVADVKWCRFIIRQFLTNAIKYSPFGGMITISITVNGNGQTILKIQDEGPGIEPHELPRVFDKGFTGGVGRIHNAATGLGLYLAQTVAIKIGVTLAVHSEKGSGTMGIMQFSNENDFDKMKRHSMEHF